MVDTPKADAGAVKGEGDKTGRLAAEGKPRLEPGTDKPLLLDTVPGEDEGRRPELERVGQAMLFIGAVTLFLFFGLMLLAMPSHSLGWDAVWFNPGSQFGFVPWICVLLVVVGGLLFLIGRRIKSIPDDED